MRKPNKYGLVPSGDVCLKHCEPLINSHGCSEQIKPIKEQTIEDEEQLSECCGAPIIYHDLCSECKEHCL